uniref:Uncharacterized protein n=1 Tax=Panstrongylus lignarius TaxID=156445 RepID=A0A224Y4Y2_9HEMI
MLTIQIRWGIDVSVVVVVMLLLGGMIRSATSNSCVMPTPMGTCPSYKTPTVRRSSFNTQYLITFYYGHFFIIFTTY